MKLAPLLFGLGILSAVACAAPKVCTPGAQIACACIGGRAGAQVCNADGTELGTCDCAAGTGGATASSSSSSATSGAGCFDYGGFDGTAPVVAFAADVLPVFRQSCGLSTSCHGDPAGGALPGQHFYGPSNSDPAPTAADIAAIFAGAVGQPAAADPDMDVVKPGDPAHSFMMYKLDADPIAGPTCASLTCAQDMSCLLSMPSGGPQLPLTTRDTIRRWIAQGAQND